MRLPEAGQRARHGRSAEVDARDGFPGRTVFRERGVWSGSYLRQQPYLILRTDSAMPARPRQRGH